MICSGVGVPTCPMPYSCACIGSGTYICTGDLLSPKPATPICCGTGLPANDLVAPGPVSCLDGSKVIEYYDCTGAPVPVPTPLPVPVVCTAATCNSAFGGGLVSCYTGAAQASATCPSAGPGAFASFIGQFVSGAQTCCCYEQRFVNGVSGALCP